MLDRARLGGHVVGSTAWKICLPGFQGVDFSAAEKTLRCRLSKLSKNAEILRLKKQAKTGSENGELSHTEASKVPVTCSLVESFGVLV